MEEKNINVKKLRIPELIDFSFKGQDDKSFVMAIKKYLSVYGLNSNQDYYNFLAKEQDILKNKRKVLFDNTIQPDIESIYTNYIQTIQKQTSPTFIRLARRYALEGMTKQDPIDDEKLHNQVLNEIKSWKEKVLKKIENDFPEISLNQTEKEKILDFYSSLKNFNLDIKFDKFFPNTALGKINALETLIYEKTDGCEYFKGLKSPMRLQDQKQGYLFIENAIVKDRPIDMRLYLNIKANNRFELMDTLKNECIKNKIPFSGKILLEKNDRNDNFIIYTNFDNQQDILNIIKDVHDKKIDLFELSENTPKLAGKLRNIPYVAVGEEPLLLKTGEQTSFSAIRERIFKEYYKENGITFKKKDFSEICQSYGVSFDNFAFTTDTYDFCNSKENLDKRLNYIESIKENCKENHSTQEQ